MNVYMAEIDCWPMVKGEMQDGCRKRFMLVECESIIAVETEALKIADRNWPSSYHFEYRGAHRVTFPSEVKLSD